MAGSLLLAMALLHFLHTFIPSIPLWVSGLASWLVLALLLYAQPKRQFIQFYCLAGLGLVFLLWALGRGATLNGAALLEQNNGLLVMLYGVSFLRLVSLPNEQSTQTSQGKLAFLANFSGIQIIGAVINLSILVVVGEYFKSKKLLNTAHATIMGRAFSIAALWSPFFASMGVALTYAPGASLIQVVMLGSGIAVIASTLSLIELGGIKGNKIKAFEGYPLKLNSVAIPIFLAVSIMILHLVVPTIKILTLVALLAMSLTVLLLIIKHYPVRKTLKTHIEAAPLRMARELGLFLGAGLMTIGLQVLLSTYPDLKLFNQFGAFEASLVLGAAIIVSLIGIHPLISISLAGPMLVPLVPDLNYLAVLFLCIWSLGVVASPLSGMNVMMQGQLGLSARELFRSNINYVVVMWGLVTLAFMWLLRT